LRFWKLLGSRLEIPKIRNFIEETYQKVEQKLIFKKKNSEKIENFLLNLIKARGFNENDPLKLKALVYLGRLYYHGLLDQKNKLINYEKAIEYWEKAKIKGDPRTSYLLGLAYYSGKGVKRDIRKGKEYIEKAKNLGFKAASHALDNLSYSSSKKNIKGTG
jgi:TPR repeat protein